ncbi:lysocardiolipin acyltransferase 1-like [Aricia agestis]|uniref:lysocardiolipin acyltransferase 1-like n=1 Tax=Aricia agestis TaxID=91739 RepID=UPI001C201F47|nr:lysocardiolipin acyltransferase 1-like [Aricia agestis]
MAIGFVVCAAWFFTILAGFYVLYCPVLYLLFINHAIYRKAVDVLFALWELYPTALFQWCCNTELHHYGDYVDPDETTIIFMNHRTRLDWNYVWIALYHATQKPDYFECICKGNAKASTAEKGFLNAISRGKSKIKYVLKDEIKCIPGMGWIMQLNYFLYVKRNWQEDQLSLSQFVDYYSKLRYNVRVVLFPEGTDLSEENKRRSEKFAASKQLPTYEYVLHPRTTGYVALVSRLRAAGLASVYDVTVAYDKPAQTEMDLLCGRMPKRVFFYFKRYAIEDLPHEENDLRLWLQDRWSEKNRSLQRFHEEGLFIDPATNHSPARRLPRSLDVAKYGFAFWTLVDIFFIYSFCYSNVFKFWVIYHSLLFIFVTKYFGGFQNIQSRLLNK